MPIAPAQIFEKTVGPPAPERILILGTRTLLTYPFEATDWTDLRMGFFLSLTQVDAAHPDSPAPPPAMIETISGSGGRIPVTDCYFIGALARSTGQTFLGYTNCNPLLGGLSLGNSSLVSSDGGIGTTNSNFWRPINSMGNNFSLMMIDQGMWLEKSTDGAQIHFPQIPAGAGGYATLLAIRLQRATPTSKTISLSAKTDTVNHSSDILFSNDPSAAILNSHLESFPATVQLLGPRDLHLVPDSFYFYWPFRNTRLRIHSLGLLRAA